MSDIFAVNYKNRTFGLDIMRFLSIFYVVYAHGYTLVKNDINAQNYNKIFLVDEAVTIFFVLSGFLIGKILIEIYWKEGLNLKNLFHFWARRWFRTLPNYYLILFFLLIHHFVIYQNRGVFHIRHLVFLQNFTQNPLPFFIESWSLATEEWFYLLLPCTIFIVSFFIKERKKAILFLIIISFILLPLLIRIYKSNSFNNFNPNTYQWFAHVVISRLDSTMYGVLAAFMKFFYSDKWIKYKWHYIVLAIAFHWSIRLIFSPVAYGFFSQTFAFSTESLEIMLFLPLMDSIHTAKGVFFRIISFISIISYAMYVLNLSVILDIIFPFFEKHTSLLSHNAFLNYFIYWFLTIGLSYLLFICYERPMMTLRDKI